MHSISDERNWLTWLVKVRILILMVLLAIELAVIRLTPSPLPIMPFLTGMVLWFVLSLFFLFLVSVWREHRLQAILQALHENIVQSMSGGVITTGLDGRITLVNRAAQQLLEISEAELRGRSVA